jgi:hypothetical protein
VRVLLHSSLPSFLFFVRGASRRRNTAI